MLLLNYLIRKNVVYIDEIYKISILLNFRRESILKYYTLLIVMFKEYTEIYFHRKHGFFFLNTFPTLK